MRPRVWFGERWITSIFDQFEENVRYFPALLPICDDEDPVAVLDRGDTPRLGELRMHNGTIYRWNRPVYDVFRGKPHLRVENRVLPAGPTVVDILANGAFYYGLLRALAEQDRPLWSQMSFAAAEDNFNAGARRRHRRPALLARPRRGAGDRAGAAPPAAAGPRRASRRGASTARSSDRLLGIIERRCITHQNGAEWQARTFHRIDDAEQPLDRRDSLREMLRPLRRAHAQQRAGAHLAGGLAPGAAPRRQRLAGASPAGALLGGRGPPGAVGPCPHRTRRARSAQQDFATRVATGRRERVATHLSAEQ